MGADVFITRAKGKTAKEAFAAAQERARYDHGHGGYTGTIAEKGEFTMIACESGADARRTIENLIEKNDPRIDDKWGPAGCIHLGGEDWIFFGWASC